jgi:hypothetical protein
MKKGAKTIHNSVNSVPALSMSKGLCGESFFLMN